MELKSKKVLITGASKGIGKATAIVLAKEGAIVAINYKSDDAEAKEVLVECNKYSSGNILIKADITNEKEVSAMFKEIKKSLGHWIY